jgi:hypothetical protein
MLFFSLFNGCRGGLTCIPTRSFAGSNLPFLMLFVLVQESNERTVTFRIGTPLLSL